MQEHTAQPFREGGKFLYDLYIDVIFHAPVMMHGQLFLVVILRPERRALDILPYFKEFEKMLDAGQPLVKALCLDISALQLQTSCSPRLTIKFRTVRYLPVTVLSAWLLIPSSYRI